MINKVMVMRTCFGCKGLYESSPCVSTKKPICHVVAFSFMSGAGPLWPGSSAATCVSQARKNGNFDTQECKTGGLKTYLSPGSAFSFQIRRGMRREIPGLHKATYGKYGAGTRKRRCCVPPSLLVGPLWWGLVC
jgi:hypothetical protein